MVEGSGKCVEKVENPSSLEGVIQVSASLGTNTVRVLATSSVKTVEEKIASTGYKTRLVGQVNVELFNGTTRGTIRYGFENVEAVLSRRCRGV